MTTYTFALCSPSQEDDRVYTIPEEGLCHSEILQIAAQDHEEPTVIQLPVQFEHKYMTIIEQFLTYFATNVLPDRLPVLPPKATYAVLHPQIYTWIQDLSLNELATLRQVCMYFGVEPLIDQLDSFLAISIQNDPYTIFKELHDPLLTLTSQDVIENDYPILK